MSDKLTGGAIEVPVSKKAVMRRNDTVSYQKRMFVGGWEFLGGCLLVFVLESGQAPPIRSVVLLAFLGDITTTQQRLFGL